MTFPELSPAARHDVLAQLYWERFGVAAPGKDSLICHTHGETNEAQWLRWQADGTALEDALITIACLREQLEEELRQVQTSHAIKEWEKHL